jgi:16S rRNA (guanine966-N2)-methyltransferase
VTTAGKITRPTSDRAREGLFSTVEAIRGGLNGARVLDLFAGSGAVGLEALSRGAADVLLVEADVRAARVIKANIATVGLPGARLVTDKAERVLARGPDGAVQSESTGQSGSALPSGSTGLPERAGPRDFVFADPPYAVSDDEVARVLTLLAAKGWLAPGALIAVERATRSGPLAWPAGYETDRSRRYGEATLWYGLAAGA